MIMNKQAAVGSFVLIGGAIGIVAILLFGKFHFFNPPKHDVIVFEGSVRGLTVGSAVTFRGVRVGAVDHIGVQFDPKTQTTVIPVTVELYSTTVRIKGGGPQLLSTADLVKIGLRAELKTQSFVTGSTEIDLDFYPGSTAVMHAGVLELPEIPIHASAFHQITDELSQLPIRELVDNTQAILQSMKGITAQLDSGLPPLIASFTLTSQRANRTLDIGARTLEDLQSRLAVTLDNVNHLASTGDQQLTQRGADLQRLLVSSNDTVLRARAVLIDVETLTSDRAASRENIESTLRDLAAASASLRGFANDIERNPQLLLTGRQH